MPFDKRSDVTHSRADNMEPKLERRTRLTLPAMMAALICGGMAVAGIWPSEGVAQDPLLSWLASPVFVSLTLLAAASFAAVTVAGVQADNKLSRLACEHDRRDHRHLLRRLGGEDFARRWETPPRMNNRLRELRRRQAIELEDLARLMRCDPQTLTMMEKDLYTPDVRTALMLSELLSVPVTDLFWVEHPSEDSPWSPAS